MISNHRVVLKQRPSYNTPPSEGDFHYEECPIPEIDDGQILVKTLYLSMDPYMVDTKLTGKHYSLMLSLLGLPGLAAFIGIRQKAHINPKGNQTMIVSAAAGASGSMAVQISKLEGCSRVVGICGSAEKCKFVTEDLGANDAINYKSEDVDKRLSETCPHGVDIYFDNVGGEISEAVINHMNDNGHVVLCGQIAMYNTDQEYPPPLADDIQDLVCSRDITRDRFLVLNYVERFQASILQLHKWHKMGKLKCRESVANGLDKAPQAFIAMMSGKNIGKQIVYIADP
ncbi:prostaglandin reductase 2-like [Anneissia japonica]|uniref:prostaglandin reductase 2-like n=1 Tax=Anneissia japonica TaxID=1529436 RepID=UPI001425B22D|nr:prostaglandin reductase 2-like [Anneissia japonica]